MSLWSSIKKIFGGESSSNNSGNKGTIFVLPGETTSGSSGATITTVQTTTPSGNSVGVLDVIPSGRVSGGGGGSSSSSSSAGVSSIVADTSQDQATQQDLNVIATQKDTGLTPIQKFEASKVQSYSLPKNLQINKEKESYDSRTGMFIKQSPTGYGSTSYMRPPTQKEQEKIDLAMEKGGGDLPFVETVTGVGTSFFSLGTSQLSGSALTEEETTSLYDPDSYINTVLNVVNPYKHFKVFKSNYEYKKAVEETSPMFDKLNKNYDSIETKWSSLIDKDSNTFLGDEDQYKQYSNDIGSYNAQLNTYLQDKKFNQVIEESQTRKTIGQRISSSKLSPVNKFLARGGVSGVEFLSFVNPAQRVLYGVGSIYSGGKTLATEPNLSTWEKVKAGGEIGIGLVLAKSGFKGGGTILKGSEGQGVLGRVAQWEKDLGIKFMGEEGGIARASLQASESRSGTAIKSLALPVGLGTMSGVQEYKTTGDLAVSLGAGVGTAVGVGLPVAYEGIRGGTKTTKLERQKLTEEINKLENSKLIEDPIIIKQGAGNLPNSDRVSLVAVQKTGNFKRVYTITGSVVRGEKGLTFFPDGKGTAFTTGTFKVKGQTLKGFEDTQIFSVGQFSKGINLGSVDGYNIGTSTSATIYKPDIQMSRLFKSPTGKGIVLATREGIDRIKKFLERKTISKGGDGVIEFETLGRTFTVEKKVEPREEKPLNLKEPLEFEVNKMTLDLGKIAKDRPLESYGAVIGENRLGRFMKFGEPISEISKPIKKGEIQKTPFSKTFGEPEIKQDLATPKSSRPKQIQEIKTDINLVKTEVVDIYGKKIGKRIQEKVKKGTQEAIEKIKVKSLDIPASVLAGAVKVKQKSQQLSKTQYKVKQDEAQLTKIIQDQLPAVRTKQKEAQAVKQIQKELLEPVLKQTEVVTPKIKIRITPRPRPASKGTIFGWLNNKKQIIPKKTIAPSYDVYVKHKGKFRKVTKEPVALQNAKDLQAYAVDKSTARTSKLKPRKNKPSPLQYDIPRGYYGSTRNKYRDWKQTKGKRYPLKNNKIIERSPFLIDSFQEKRGLSYWKLLSQIRKRQAQKGIPVGLYEDLMLPRNLKAPKRKSRVARPVGLTMK
jgi:hypothetical protein